jgi:hypothetical protein
MILNTGIKKAWFPKFLGATALNTSFKFAARAVKNKK